MAKQSPEKVFKIGKIHAAVFKNQSEEGYAFRSCQLTVAYKKGDKWEYGTAFTAADLAAITFLLPQVTQYMIEQTEADRVQTNAARGRHTNTRRYTEAPKTDPVDPDDLPF